AARTGQSLALFESPALFQRLPREVPSFEWVACAASLECDRKNSALPPNGLRETVHSSVMAIQLFRSAEDHTLCPSFLDHGFPPP
ncbi:MAG: hypothetical protein AAFO78_13710, partial [Pseudomonadota bacterium]